MTPKKAKQAPKSKPEKEKNPFVLGTEVAFFNGWRGVTRAGKIILVTKTLLRVEWESGNTEYFGKKGQSFFGTADEAGEMVESTARPGREQNPFGGEDDPHLLVLQPHHREILDKESREKDTVREKRRAAEAEIASDPAYQKRQNDRQRYTDLLREVSGNVEDSWNEKTNYRIELENIPPDQMDGVVDAILRGRREADVKK